MDDDAKGKGLKGMEQFQRQIKEIYDLLGDEISKCIFENRLMYSLTQDKKFIRNTVCTRQQGKRVYKKLCDSKKIKGIFGAGMLGRQLVRTYDDIKFECFIDNNCAGQICDGLPIFSLEEFKKKYPDSTIIISPKLYHKEIQQQLIENNISLEDVINIGNEYEQLTRLQYFDLPQIFEKSFSEEVFVDGGCYDGRNAVEFTKKFPGGG